MKTIQFKVNAAVLSVWRNSILKSKMVAIITLLILASTAPLTAAVLKTIPAVFVNQQSLNLPKPLIVKSTSAEQVATQQDTPTKAEKLFSIIVGIVFPVSILSLLFFLQYASDSLTDKIFYRYKTS